MALEFFLAKNSSQSAKANGALVHSAYNPEIEAERFVQALDAPFIASFVIVLEGGLGYCAPLLRKRFPGAKIGVLRFCGEFPQSELWDFSIPLGECFSQDQKAAAQTSFQDQKAAASAAPLSERLFWELGEEGLFSALFYEWPASARIWPKETKFAWEQIKAATEKAKAVLATREHFGKRWLKNKIRFFERLEKACVLEKIKKPVAICASGPSLEAAFPLIKKNRERLFVCALSSAIASLARFGVEPDLCLSSDGGWWAKKHLDILRLSFLNAPLALPTEAALPASLFKSKTILPLCYDDDELSKKLFEALEIPFASAKRNGTVSGSALEFFLQAAEGPVFFAGLDLQSGKRLCHARPNALEILEERKDFRLRPKSTRAARAALSNPSLELYADWFAAYSPGEKKVFRIRGSEPFKRSLGQIKDIGANEFESALIAETACKAKTRDDTGTASKTKTDGGQNFFTTENLSAPKSGRKETIRRVFEQWAQSGALASEMFPADSLLARREKDADKKKERILAIEEKSSRLVQEIFKEGRP